MDLVFCTDAKSLLEEVDIPKLFLQSWECKIIQIFPGTLKY